MAVTILHTPDAELFSDTASGSDSSSVLTPSSYALLEQERGRIARELHDHLGQLLICMRMGLHGLERDLQQPALQDRVRDLVRHTEMLMSSARELAHGLRLPLADVGLASAIRHLLVRFDESRQTRFRLNLNDSVLVGLDDALAATVYRFLQEALTNIVRHAQAHNVDVVLCAARDSLRVSVEDDGVGFDLAAFNAKNSYGFCSMRERVLAHHGRFFCDTKPGRGTLLSISLPYKLIPC